MLSSYCKINRKYWLIIQKIWLNRWKRRWLALVYSSVHRQCIKLRRLTSGAVQLLRGNLRDCVDIADNFIRRIKYYIIHRIKWQKYSGNVRSRSFKVISRKLTYDLLLVINRVVPNFTGFGRIYILKSGRSWAGIGFWRKLLYIYIVIGFVQSMSNNTALTYTGRGRLSLSTVGDKCAKNNLGEISLKVL